MESSSYWDFEESNLKKENEQMDGEEMQVTCTLHFMGTTLCLNLTDKRHRIQGCF